MASKLKVNNKSKNLVSEEAYEVEGEEVNAKDPVSFQKRIANIGAFIAEQFTNKDKRPKAIAVVAIAVAAVLGIAHYIGSSIVDNNRLNDLVTDTVTYASQTASEVNNGLDGVITKAKNAKTAADQAMTAATNIKTLEDAVAAYKLASNASESGIEMLAASSDENDPTPATEQAFAASADASAAIAKVQAAIKRINDLPEDRLTEELKAKKLELEKYLVDHSQEPQALPLLAEEEVADEETVVNISLQDALTIANQAHETAGYAANIAFNKVLELADENTIPNDVTFDISTDAELAKLVRGSHAGKVTEFIRGQYTGNTLALYFRGNDGWGNDAIYEVKVDTTNATYKFAEDGSADYANEIKSLMKEQKVEAGLYANILNRGNFINFDSEVKKTSTMISYSTLSKDANGNFVSSETVTLQEKGQLSEEDVIAKVVSAVEKSNASYVFVVDGEEIEL